MYRSDLNAKDKSGAIVAVAAIHAALLFVLLHLSGRIDLAHPDSVIRVFDISEEPVPPPEPIVEQTPRKKAKEPEGAASPKNIKSKATEVAAPRPEVSLPVPVPVETSKTPNQGTDSTQGASDVAGPGTGAGGTGTGTGSGGSGSGTGGGGIAVGASLVRGITNSDYPRAIQRQWPRGGRIFLRLRIEPNGRPSQCDVMRSFGNQSADQLTCRLVMDRAVFRPARNAIGEPVASWFGYVQSDTGRFAR